LIPKKIGVKIFKQSYVSSPKIVKRASAGVLTMMSTGLGLGAGGVSFLMIFDTFCVFYDISGWCKCFLFCFFGSAVFRPPGRPAFFGAHQVVLLFLGPPGRPAIFGGQVVLLWFWTTRSSCYFWRPGRLILWSDEVLLSLLAMRSSYYFAATRSSC
jgi:hypothetical protein